MYNDARQRNLLAPGPNCFLLLFLDVSSLYSVAGNYIVVFDPLDGSSNIDAGISTGSIWGIYAPSQECSLEAMDDPEKMMVSSAAQMALYNGQKIVCPPPPPPLEGG